MFCLPLEKWSPRPLVNVWLLALSSWSEEEHMWKEVIFFFLPKRWCILNVCGIRAHIRTTPALPPWGLIFFSCVYEMRSNKRITSQDTQTQTGPAFDFLPSLDFISKYSSCVFARDVRVSSVFALAWWEKSLDVVLDVWWFQMIGLLGK